MTSHEIREEYRAKLTAQSRRQNILEAYFITVGKQELFNKLIFIADSDTELSIEDWTNLCLEVKA